jgi:hypothetical protein
MYLMFLWRGTRFQGQLLIVALVMDIARLKIIMYRAIKTTGTLLVKQRP